MKSTNTRNTSQRGVELAADLSRLAKAAEKKRTVRGVLKERKEKTQQYNRFVTVLNGLRTIDPKGPAPDPAFLARAIDSYRAIQHEIDGSYQPLWLKEQLSKTFGQVLLLQIHSERTKKTPGKQVDLEEMIQEVTSRTKSGKLKRQDTLKIRVPVPFKQLLKRFCSDVEVSESKFVIFAVCKELQGRAFLTKADEKILADLIEEFLK